ncbi:hypothetical protein JYB88_13160 [Shewanella cyperi]|uniref:Uncharacterized protein n=1 Tax=Shewanella cyperi TaxID=2814292 RepID=A0A974XJ05_9GAMM|nr:hypothetical protein [Shewanella cyperi]QSX29174.1 hypothetical protein JYB88_13160 [Shewanella cyperi]
MNILLPLTLLAGINGQAMAAPEMETLTVTYRSPLDYALYQQTTETISFFRIELAQDILAQSRASSRAMASHYLSHNGVADTRLFPPQSDWLTARRN